MSDPPKEKKKKKAIIEYNIDPNLSEEEQRRLRKQIRAERRAEREERRKHREDPPKDRKTSRESLAVPGFQDNPLAGPVSPRRGGSKKGISTTESNSRKGSATEKKESTGATDWSVKQKEEEQRKERERVAQRQTELDSLKEQRAEEAAEARKTAKEKERLALEEAERQKSIKEHQDKMKAKDYEEEQKERRRQEKLTRERRAQEEEERRKEEEERVRDASIRAAKAEREAKELAIREAKMREEQAKRREEERRRMELEDAERRKREEIARRQTEEERREREKKEVERAALRAKEREEFERRRELEMQKYKEELARTQKESFSRLTEREKDELARQEEERWKAQERRERTKQVWAERLREAEDKVRRRYGKALSELREMEEKGLSKKLNFAGMESEEWLYNPVPVKVFYSLGALKEVAEMLLVDLSVPEWVVVGQEDASKSNVVDALLGLPVFKGIVVKRIFRIQLEFDGELETTPVAYFDDDVKVEMLKIPAEIQSRNVESDEECVVTIRYKFFLDLTFTVTPDLPATAPNEVLDPGKCERVLKEIMPIQRMILWIDRADSTDEVGSQFARLAGVADKFHKRSVLVLNGLSEVLSEYTLTSEVNGLLGQTHPAPVFFVSYSKDKNTREDIVAASARDESILKKLKSYHSFDEKVGMKKLALHIQKISHQIFQRMLAPRIKSQISSNSVKTLKKLEQNKELQRTIQPSELKAFSSRYLMDYLHAFKAALNGTAGDPFSNGETLQEEREAVGMGQGWLISSSLRTPNESKKESLANQNVRLLGRLAFCRLIEDLQKAIQMAPLAAIDTSFLTSCGPARSGLKPEFALAASDAASKRCRDVLFPLVRDALKRGGHICKRLTSAAESAMKKRLAHSKSAISHAPFFHSAIRDIVYDFVDMQVARCTFALEDEFRSTSITPIRFNALLDRVQPVKEDLEIQQIRQISTNFTEELKSRFLENTKLKLFEYLLDPLNEVVQNFVQSRISSIHTEELESMLEPDAARARLMEEQIRYDQEQLINTEYLRIFNQNINDFSHY